MMPRSSENRFDVIIIGSGLGGLMCAQILGMHGYKVCVLEKNRQFGGNLQIFSRDKCIFDTGVHYLGGMDKGQNLYQCFKYVGIIDKLKLKRMDSEAFDVITFSDDEKEYWHGIGYDNYQKNLVKDFPEEAENIKAYCDGLQEICNLFPVYYLDSSTKDYYVNKYFHISAKAFIESFTSNKRLQQVLGATNLLYAGHNSSPAYMHALIINSYIESAWRCVNGGSQIALELVKAIKADGGVVKNYAEVKKIIVEDRAVTAVELENGESYYADRFISNLHPKITIDMVGGGVFRKSFENRIKQIENTPSMFTIHIVLKPNRFKYLNRNIYHYKNENVWETMNYTESSWPESYMLLTPATTKSDEYADSITVMTYMSFSEMEKWKDTYNTMSDERDRGEGYEAFKTRKAEKLIDEIEKKIPEIRAITKTYYTSSPLTYRDYINTPEGCAYGVNRDCENPLKSYLSPRTKIDNLYLTGQSLNMHGVLGVSVGAIITCSQIIDGKKLIDSIREA